MLQPTASPVVILELPEVCAPTRQLSQLTHAAKWPLYGSLNLQAPRRFSFTPVFLSWSGHLYQFQDR